MAPNKWEIWFVDMPYEDGIGSKVRPALVVDPGINAVLVGKMTSHPPRPNYPYEYQLIDWQGAGLKVQTTLRLSKLVRLSPGSFKRKIGIMMPTDQVQVHNMLVAIMASGNH